MTAVLRTDTIRREGSKWVLYSKDGSRRLGEFESEGAAQKREAEIVAIEHARGDSDGAAVLRFDSAGSLRRPERTPEGWLRVEAYTTRVGVFDEPDGKGGISRELRLPEEVFSPETLASFSLVPVTNLHPPYLLDAETAKFHQRGSAGTAERADNEWVKQPLVITDAQLISEMEANQKREVSNGYRTVLEERAGTVGPEHGLPAEWLGRPFDRIQRRIRGNHIAIVDRARAGDGAAVRMDSRTSGGDTMKRAQIRERIKQFLPALGGVRSAVRADAAGDVIVKRGDDTWNMPAGLLGGLAELLEAADGELAKPTQDERENDEDKPKADEGEGGMEGKGGEGEPPKKKEDDDDMGEGKMDSAEAKALRKENAALRKNLDQLTARFDSFTAGRDKLVADAVAAGERRASLINRSRVVMGERFDGAGMSEGQIHAAVLERSKVTVPAGRSADYIAARCDSVLEQAEKDAEAQRAGYAALGARMDGAGAPGQDIEATARAAMLERQRNAWQSKGA